MGNTCPLVPTARASGHIVVDLGSSGCPPRRSLVGVCTRVFHGELIRLATSSQTVSFFFRPCFWIWPPSPRGFPLCVCSRVGHGELVGNNFSPLVLQVAALASTVASRRLHSPRTGSHEFPEAQYRYRLSQTLVFSVRRPRTNCRQSALAPGSVLKGLLPLADFAPIQKSVGA